MIKFLKNIYFYILEVFTSSDLKAPVIEYLDKDKITETDDLSLPIHSVDLTSEYSELIKTKTNYIQFKYLVVNQNPKDLLLSIDYNTYSGFGWHEKEDTSLNMPININGFKEENIDELVLAPTIRAEDIKNLKQYQLADFEYEKVDGMFYINAKTIDINPIDKLDSSVKIKIENVANIKGLKSYITYITI